MLFVRLDGFLPVDPLSDRLAEVEAVEFGGFEDRVDRGGRLAAAVEASEGPVSEAVAKGR
jgi:hypothetical protein